MRVCRGIGIGVPSEDVLDGGDIYIGALRLY